jgi:Tfp pilus assembly protein PilX
MKRTNSPQAGQRGAVATVLVLIVIGLLTALVMVGLDSVSRARRGVRAVEDQQAKRWAEGRSGVLPGGKP